MSRYSSSGTHCGRSASHSFFDRRGPACCSTELHLSLVLAGARRAHQQFQVPRARHGLGHAVDQRPLEGEALGQVDAERLLAIEAQLVPGGEQRPPFDSADEVRARRADLRLQRGPPGDRLHPGRGAQTSAQWIVYAAAGTSEDMTATRTLMLAALMLPGLALAHHHHHHHHHGSSHQTEMVCVRWAADVTASASLAQDPDAGTCGCEVSSVEPDAGDVPDGGADAGTLLESETHTGEHCVEWAPAVGCSTGTGLMPFAGGLFWLLRRRVRRSTASNE